MEKVFTVSVIHLRVQTQPVVVAACRRPTLRGWRSCSTCGFQSPGWGWGWGRWGGWRQWRRVDHSHLWMLLFEGRRPRGASLWRCGILTLGEHYLHPRLRAKCWRWGSTAAHGLFVWGQGHLDSFHHDGHRLTRNTLITARCGGGAEEILCLLLPRLDYSWHDFEQQLTDEEIWVLAAEVQTAPQGAGWGPLSWLWMLRWTKQASQGVKWDHGLRDTNNCLGYLCRTV